MPVVKKKVPLKKVPRRSTKTRYTEKQRADFLTLASKEGIATAIKKLGYPARDTAESWVEKYDVQVPRTPLALAATAMKSWYGITEQRIAAQAALDASYERLTEGEPVLDEDGTHIGFRPLGAREIGALASAVQRAIQTLNLVEGKATEIIESHADTAPELMSVIDKYREENAEKVRHLRLVKGEGAQEVAS